MHYAYTDHISDIKRALRTRCFQIVGRLARIKTIENCRIKKKPVELPASQYFLQCDGTKRKASFVTVFKARRKVIPIDSFEQEEAGSMLKETTMKFCRELD